MKPLFSKTDQEKLPPKSDSASGLFIHLKFIPGFFSSPPAALLLLLMAIYTGGIMWLHAIRLSRMVYGFDLAFYQQAIWNTLNGRFLEVSATDFSNSLLGTDAILIYALMAPFYALWQSPLALLLIETIIVAAGALPVYWLAKDKLNSRWAGFGLAVIYLMLLPVQNGNLYELRERPIAMSFLLFSFYFYEKRRFKLFLVFTVLVLMCRPENGLALVMLALYGFIKNRQRESGWRYIIFPLALGIIWFGLDVFLVIPFSSTSGSIALGENYPGGSPQAALLMAITNPAQGLPAIFPTDQVLINKALYIPCLLLPLLFLSLGSPSTLLMALPALALNLLSIRPIQWNAWDYHYQGSIVPWVLAGAIFTLEKGKKSARFSEVNRNRLVYSLIGLALVLTVLIFALGPNKLRLPKEEPHWQDGKALLAQIPPDAPLAITNTWAAQVPPRQGLWLFRRRTLYSMHPEQGAIYIFAWKRGDDGREGNLVNEILKDSAWRIQAERGDYVLLKKN